jgi:hypothetical protein
MNRTAALSLAFFVLLLMLIPFAGRAQSRVITITPADVQVTGGRVAFTDDGGCTLQPECTTTIPGVRCDGSPQVWNGAAKCGAARTAVTRAANIDVGVSDGGLP